MGTFVSERMATSVEQPTGRRGATGGAQTPSRGNLRSRLAVPVLAALSMLFFAAALAVATGTGSLFGDEKERASGGLPPEWGSLEPLLPVAPSLEAMAELKRGADGWSARDVPGRGGGGDALRLRARPVAADEGAPAAPAPASGRSPARPDARRAAPLGGPEIVRPLTTRFVETVPLLVPDLGDVLDGGLPDLPPLFGGGGLPDLPRLPGRVTIPPIDPLPGRANRLPSAPLPVDVDLSTLRQPGGGGAPGAGPLAAAATAPALTVTITDVASDPSLDLFTASVGESPSERYVFADGDIADLATQINLRSRLLVADALRDGVPLARLDAAPVGAAAAAATRSGRVDTSTPAGGRHPGARRDREGGAGARGGGGEDTSRSTSGSSARTGAGEGASGREGGSPARTRRGGGRSHGSHLARGRRGGRAHRGRGGRKAAHRRGREHGRRAHRSHKGRGRGHRSHSRGHGHGGSGRGQGRGHGRGGRD